MTVLSPRLAALSAADADAPLLRLPGGGHLAVKRWGSGAPILCLHAVGHGGGDFAELAGRLSDGYELIALDWPGMGRSPADGGAVRARRYGRLVLAAADALGLERPLVLGNSIGGAAAIVAAADAPGRFAGLVLCNPGGLAPLDPAARAVIGAMAALFRAGARGARWFPAVFAAYYSHLVLARPAAAARRALIVGAARELAPLLADAWAGFGEPDSDLRAIAPALRLPVWLAWARDDRFVAWSRAKAAVATMPRHRVTLFSGSHAAFLEDPDAFAAGLRTFAAQAYVGALAP